MLAAVVPTDVASPAMAIMVGLFAAFGGFLFGYDTGNISGIKAMPYFIELFGEADPVTGVVAITTATDSLITSILSAGTFFGALSSAYVGTILGRRIGLCAYLVVFCVGVALQTAARATPLFAVGRVFAGFGVGGVSCLVPIYQSEVSPKKIRGAIVCTYQLFITIGLLIAAVVVNSTQFRPDASCYQIPIALQFVWAAIIAAGLVVLPESPRWLITRGRDADARKAMSRLMRVPVDSDLVVQEIAEITANVHNERAQGEVSYMDALFRTKANKLPKRVWTGIMLQSLQQLSGINFIFYYGTTFFRNSGISSPFLITIATNVVNVGATLPGIFLCDRIGRRPLMIWGAVAMAVCQLIVAATGTAVGTFDLPGQRTLIAFVCIYIAFFAAFWGPLAWVITSELVPNAARSKAVSLTTGAQWLLNFAIGYSTPYLVDIGPGRAGLGAKVFFIWGGCCVLATVFAYFYIPETAGLSLEQIDILYRNSTITGSTAYNKKIKAENLHDEDTDAYRNVGQDKASVGSHNEFAKRDLATEA